MSERPAQGDDWGGQNGGDDLDARLRRIEEACAQASYEQDQLNAHVLRLMRTIEQAAARVARLERTIEGLRGDAGGGGKRPEGGPGLDGRGLDGRDENENTPPEA